MRGVGRHCRRQLRLGNGLEGVLPVDVYLPGCPPNPAAIIEALLMFLDRAPQRVSGGRMVANALLLAAAALWLAAAVLALAGVLTAQSRGARASAPAPGSPPPWRAFRTRARR